MKHIILLMFSLFIIKTSFSQLNYTLPDGYNSYKDFNGNESITVGDFDGDGIKDYAIVCLNKDEEKGILINLASKWLVDQAFWWFPWNYNNYELSFVNGILKISTDDDYDYIDLKFKYISELNNMRLIGYSRTYYMRHPTKFIGSNNINLIAGLYSVNDGLNKKINISVITLSNIEKYFDYLSKVGGVFPE